MNVLNIYYVELDKIDDAKSEQLIEILNTLLVNKKEQSLLGIPLLIKMKNGTIVDYLSGVPVYNNVSEQLNEIWIKQMVLLLMRKDR